MTLVTPLVSIVVPVYNAEKYVEKTIDSLLAQTYENLEIIAVNDGSTDSSLELLKKYSKQIRIIDQKNSGQSSALNVGWEASTGETLGYLSADDILLPYAIDNLIIALTHSPDSVAIYPDYYLIDQDGRRIREVKTPHFSLDELVIRGVCQPGPGALFSREAWKKTGGWNPSIKQIPDYDFWLRLSLHGALKRHPSLLAEFRVHGESQSFAISTPEKSEEPIQVLEGYFQETHAVPEIIRKKERVAMAYGHLLSARLHYRSGRNSEGNAHLKKSVTLSPFALLTPLGLNRIISGLAGRWRYRMQHKIK